MLKGEIFTKRLLKSFSVLLSFLLLLNMSGYWGIYWAFSQYQYQVHLNKTEAEAYQEDELEVLKFAKDKLKNNSINLEWLEKREFRYQEKLYDIVESTEVEDSIRYKVKRDVAEEEMAKQIGKWNISSQNQPLKQGSGMVSWVKLIIQQAKLYSPLNVVAPAESYAFFMPYLRQHYHTSLMAEVPPPLASF